jgi:hypothetical protein
VTGSYFRKKTCGIFFLGCSFVSFVFFFLPKNYFGVLVINSSEEEKDVDVHIVHS